MVISRTPAPSELFFRGRPGDIRIGEWVTPCDTLGDKQRKHEAVYFGYPDDQGVRRNRGRAGASGGPDSVRRHFYRMTLPADKPWEDKLALWDLGNSAVSAGLRETHSRAEAICKAVGMSARVGIAVGGGHDFAAPTFRGFASAAPKAKWGLINVDPHLDTREAEGDTPHSGNPFRFLIDEGALKGSDFVEFGARNNRNTRSAWKYCQDKKVNLFPLEEIRAKKTPVASLFQSALSKLSTKCSRIGLTIDMDSCCDAEGVSAAPVLGFSAWELCCFAAAAGKNPRVAYLEIAEVAPGLDVEERSSRIAAEVIFAFLQARSRLP